MSYNVLFLCIFFCLWVSFGFLNNNFCILLLVLYFIICLFFYYFILFFRLIEFINIVGFYNYGVFSNKFK